ncbi:hypothetical protein [Nocardia araoensis]|uniref:hypothetical protein n=1 Tax=Nocardia araoensis TaxID=228600 RepID=UPI0012F705AC|nr:hypothetical protein [Nocardia araoensis]
MGDNDPDDGTRDTEQPRQQDSSEQKSWIRRHSGTILTTLLFPIVSGLIVLAVEKFTDDKDDDSARTSTSTTQTTVSSEARTPSSTTSPAPATSAAAGSNDVRWSGTLNMTYLDLDSVPPRVLPNNGGASAWVSYDRESSGGFSAATLYGLGGGFFTTKPTLAQWTTSAAPTRQQCSDLISTQGAETLPITKDSAYCVKTAAGRTAFITGLSLDNAVHAYTASVTVWSATQ